MLSSRLAGKKNSIVRAIEKIRSVFFRSVRINFQYAVDVLCGSLNRDCDVKKLFKYIGLQNTQSPVRIEFVFVNGTYYDPELKRTFQPSPAKMFACDEPVILPHMSRDKCTCMDCNSMCPKWNRTEPKRTLPKNSSDFQRIVFSFTQLHLTTKLAIGIYLVFIVLFILGNLIVVLCHSNQKKTSKSAEYRSSSFIVFAFFFDEKFSF